MWLQKLKAVRKSGFSPLIKMYVLLFSTLMSIIDQQLQVHLCINAGIEMWVTYGHCKVVFLEVL